MTEQLTVGALAYQHRVLMRRERSYDYEKVFWSSVWSVGLVTLGWVAVKLGQAVAWIQDPLAASTRQGLEGYAEYVWGSKADVPIEAVPILLQPGVAMFRKNPDALKAQIAEQEEKGDKPALKILEVADRVYGEVGAILPLGVVASQVLIEYLRVRKLRSELDVPDMA